MYVQDYMVDSEGYVHAEIVLEKESKFKRQAILGFLSHKFGINEIQSVDRRVEETGFEFWHVVGY